MASPLIEGCPFGATRPSSPKPLKDSNTLPTLPTGKARVKLLYEEYIHLPDLRAVWDSPITDSPVLEPIFTSMLHGVELCFLLLAEFIADPRDYVAKRPRIERVADDIAKQCKILVDVIDGELEEEDTKINRLTLTQEFPFPSAPPTRSQPSHSPCLARLEAAIRTALPTMTMPERNSLVKVVINLTDTAFGAFQRWSVGLGLEPQLNSLREAVGLTPLAFPHKVYLDYGALVRPEVVERTLTRRIYTYHEDFFFRTVHLGTECWGRVALARLQSARELAEAGNWHTAAARILQASRILDYLGSHVMLLTSMNLRDYLYLKVELEGTSGEGSVQVKSFRPTIAALFEPLEAALLPVTDNTSIADAAEKELALGQALLEVYEFPDRTSTIAPVSYRELYNYAKALEDVESGLLGGFYFKHFRLAANVIGSDAKGTMRRAVQALKSTYERPIFPILDRVRSGLGAKVDAELAHVKGRMMQDIIDAYLQKKAAPEGGEGRNISLGGEVIGTSVQVQVPPANGALHPLTTCPFKSAPKPTDTAISISAPSESGAATLAAVESEKGALESMQMQRNPIEVSSSSGLSESTSAAVSLSNVYSWKGVPEPFQKEVETALDRLAKDLHIPLRALSKKDGPVAFLDHAWGRIPPAALHAALIDAAALYSLGNPAWDLLFGSIMPTAAGHIRRLLGIEPALQQAQHGDGTSTATVNVYSNANSSNINNIYSPQVDVHFGHNSHELICRLLSELLISKRFSSEMKTNNFEPLRVLTTDCEFYSITRQLNRLTQEGAVEVHAVPAEPAGTFPERCLAAAAESATSGHPFQLVYLSQVTSLTQQTLLPDLSTFVPALASALNPGKKENAPKSSTTSIGTAPVIIIDGYHSFCALPTPLGSSAAQQCCFVGGLIKHAGSGANCAFITLPRHRSLELRPTFTGWLADPSVLGPGSIGVQLGSEVEYSPELALQGGTPAFFLPLLTFNHVQKLWQAENVGVKGIHGHVQKLQDMFLDALPGEGNLIAGGDHIGKSSLVGGGCEVELPNGNRWRSHTLVFEQESPQKAAEVVNRAKHGGVLIDSRKQFVRVGFGPNHTTDDVEMLLRAVCSRK